MSNNSETIPIRGELFSLERLEQHAEALAETQKVRRKPSRGHNLLSRVTENGRVLMAAHRVLSQAVKDDRSIAPAAAWFLDNYYVVEEQLLGIRDHLPRSFYIELPKLTTGPFNGYPRVYGLVWDFVAHTDSRFDAEWFKRFIRSYQKVEPLTIGEGWALAIALRIILVENLRRLADQIIGSRLERIEADRYADRLRGKDPAPWQERPMHRAFVVQLLQRLREQESDVAPVIAGLEKFLKDQNTSADQVIQKEHQDQTAMNATVRNIITSMRLISATDWTEFFESVSMVDDLLRDAGSFASMEFRTRDHYRHAIEELARGSKMSEVEVTKRVIAAASAHSASASLPDIEAARRRDPGYYLISSGRRAFEQEIGFKVSIPQRLFRFYMARSLRAYIGSIFAGTALIAAFPALAAMEAGESWPLLLTLSLLSLIPASELAISLLNRFFTESLKPKPLPKLDFSKGLPKEAATLVVVPTFLDSPENIDAQVADLEVHYLANSNGFIQFGLLSDWKDSDKEISARDEKLLAAAREKIGFLNQRHGPGPEGLTRFFLFHRRRVFNPKEGVWMGWERKRGKLEELNRWLKGDRKTSFLPVDDKKGLENIRYCITLDADTRMPRGAAYRLAGAMRHPLNRPRINPEENRVVDGYGVLQPRITPVLPAAGAGSYYQRIFSGPAGIDPYAFAVSDVYQDLFKEGSYVGKGIYDVDVFQTTMEGRVPENALLSHDLFEGIFARAGLITDVEFFEDFPEHYEVASSRQHRWMRGDWQLLPWFFKKGLTPLGRWKLIDNLRRSFQPLAVFFMFILAWKSKQPWGWAGWTLATLAVPTIIPACMGVLTWHKNFSFSHHLYGLLNDVRLAFDQTFLNVAFLAHQARTAADAIARTLWRVFISRRRLLQWVSFAHAKKSVDCRLIGFYFRMGAAPFLAGAAAVLFWVNRAPPESYAFPLLWFLSPWIAKVVSVPRETVKRRPLSEKERRDFRFIARKTWRYFETHVTKEHNYLPPDNFQEEPKPVVANRTSPTNIGLYLLSTVAARDFGWIGVMDMVDRLEQTMSTLREMKRYKGHFFNWYDTRDLRALDPAYVSTVDSGNLAGHLIAVENACRQFLDGSFLWDGLLDGVNDTLGLIEQNSIDALDDRRAEMVTAAHWRQALQSIRTWVENKPSTPQAWARALADLNKKSEILLDMARTRAPLGKKGTAVAALEWCEILHRQVQSYLRDSNELMPWVTRDFEVGIKEIPDICDRLLQESKGIEEGIDVSRRSLEKTRLVSAQLIRRMVSIARFAAQTVREMEFQFLFDPSRKLFSIGYQIAEKKLDPSYYDLLASEARLASFVAIAKGDIPSAHWFHLTRSFARADGGLALMSWSGSMFEYLMPALVMRELDDSLLSQTERHVVRTQISYGNKKRTPWGISEAGYNVRDLELTYQYSNFGIPGLGLKRGLSKDHLIAPYATALAAMVDPVAAAANFRRLAKIGGEGRFGFYEALDFTPDRVRKDHKFEIVKSYMAHHQAMTIVAIDNVLNEGVMKRRFHRDPLIQASELLLQERMPRDAGLARVRSSPGLEQSFLQESSIVLSRRFTSWNDTPPRTHLLSNGRYNVMLTSSGSGYSRWNDLAVTRWREDVTRDAHGTYIFLRDVDGGDVWSAGFQPRGVEPDRYEVDFSEDRAQFIRRDGSITTIMDVVVSPEDDAEIRQITLKNDGGTTRTIELTSYAEIVLTSAGADAAHPAFSNLFVQTEFVEPINAVVCARRPRSPDDPEVWAAHVLASGAEAFGPVEFESDRNKFLGRGREVRTPVCVIDGKPLTNTAGSVLDPIVSLRQRVRVLPGQTVVVTFSTVVASSKEALLALADKYHDPTLFERTQTLAWTQSQVQRHYLGVEIKDLHLFQELASRVIYSHSSMRASQEILRKNERGAQGLWAFGISGDLPIVLVRVEEIEDRELVHYMLRAHEYWRLKNLAVDLVIVNEKAGSYLQELQQSLENLLRTSQAGFYQAGKNPRGGIFILQSDRLSKEDRLLLQSAARVVLISRNGTLADQLERLRTWAEHSHPSVSVARTPASTPAAPVVAEPDSLEFFNGLGGFYNNGREYQIVLSAGQWTPAPWINVIANPNFGFTASESGSGAAWCGNARENKLTPWSNDPVSDTPGEVFYVRDEETGKVWTPTALPIREETWPYVATHGQGYSRFEHESHGIHLSLLQFVPTKDPLKISQLTLTNRTSRPRRISVCLYVEWVLGVNRSASAPFVRTERDPALDALLATNPWNAEFRNRISFLYLSGPDKTWTGDRTEFLGRNGNPDRPGSLENGRRLSGRVGPGLDPCGAIQAVFDLKPGSSVDVLGLLGQGESLEEVSRLLNVYKKADPIQILDQIRKQWDAILGGVEVRTPDREMNFLLNRWLQYQTLACRVWARSAFYQSGGAYGFRDQLQDLMALVVSRRDLTREHILKAAARQFPEGDVQHWWHPPLGKGVRTRFSDDLLWLPYAVINYLEATEDFSILDEMIPFIEGPSVPEGKEDAYFEPVVSAKKATLFEHCALALDRSLKTGEHGLPLIGSGDWNDGMNRVGHEGKGESVWLGWFLHTILWEFAKFADRRGEARRAETWRLKVGDLKSALERFGWDGEWYRRGYFDDGTPLGTASAKECRIDSIAQSWGVISGGADPARAVRAMAAVEQHLIKYDPGLILLLTPPFDKSKPSPGYIEGYVPGVRENGGQYTHAAIWVILAYAALGDGDKAQKLFNLINPINRGKTRSGISRYKVEPYVVAADVYGEAPHAGRGGWTWYTGSSGWMYRAGVEWILGLRLRGTTLFMDPCIPRDWPGFEISFRYHTARYEIRVSNPNGVCKGVLSAEMDGKPVRGGAAIRLVDDGAAHRIDIVLGKESAAEAASKPVQFNSIEA